MVRSEEQVRRRELTKASHSCPTTLLVGDESRPLGHWRVVVRRAKGGFVEDPLAPKHRRMYRAKYFGELDRSTVGRLSSAVASQVKSKTGSPRRADPAQDRPEHLSLSLRA